MKALYYIQVCDDCPWYRWKDSPVGECCHPKMIERQREPGHSAYAHRGPIPSMHCPLPDYEPQTPPAILKNILESEMCQKMLAKHDVFQTVIKSLGDFEIRMQKLEGNMSVTVVKELLDNPNFTSIFERLLKSQEDTVLRKVLDIINQIKQNVDPIQALRLKIEQELGKLGDPSSSSSIFTDFDDVKRDVLREILATMFPAKEPEASVQWKIHTDDERPPF